MVYCASSLSLAALELLVHLDVADAPTDYVSIRADLPEHVQVEERDVASLPRDWRSYPAPLSLQDIGDEWVTSGRTVALMVPSVVTPIETNILLNPAHPDLSKLTRGTPQAYQFDPRLF
jgi:RES domain-containing protein